MKVLSYFFTLAIVFTALSCSNDENTTQHKETLALQKDYKIFDNNETKSFTLTKTSNSWQINKKEAIEYLMVVFDIKNLEEVSDFAFYYEESLGEGSISILHTKSNDNRSVGINFHTNSNDISGKGTVDTKHECTGGSCSFCEIDKNWWGKIVGCDCIGNGNCIHKVTITY